MTNLELIGGVSAIAVIMGLVQVAKMLGLKENYAPLLALALGQLASIAYFFYSSHPWYQVVITGFVIGLSAMGLYDCTKDTVNSLRKTKAC